MEQLKINSMPLRKELATITKKMEQDNVPYIMIYKNPENGDIIFGANGKITDLGMLLYSAMEDQPTFNSIIKAVASTADRIDNLIK